MEEAFAKHYATTGDATYSAHKAGYAHPQPRGSELSHDPAVMALAVKIRRSKLAQASIEAVDVLVEGMRDEKAPRQARNNAASIILKYASVDGASGETKDPHEMTPDELAAALARAKAQAAALANVAADRAKPVIEASPADVFE